MYDVGIILALCSVTITKLCYISHIIIGHKEKVSVKKNLAYEVPTLCKAEGGAKLPAEMNIVYEEIY